MSTDTAPKSTRGDILRDRKSKYLIANNDANHKQILKDVELDSTRKRFRRLLSMSDLFRHFIESKASADPSFKEFLDSLDTQEGGDDDDDTNANGKKSKKTVTVRQQRRKTEREEDAELLRDEQDGGIDENLGAVDPDYKFMESPGFINGTLRPYQVQGLNWLISLHNHGLAGILADEMGLGKTLQTISFLGYLKYVENISGPFLIIAPKSTLNNWLREINHWTPGVDAFVLQGNKEERAQLIKDKLSECDFDIVVASYEIVIREKAAFKKFNWEYIIIDEAHRIKNEESLLSQVLRGFHSHNRLLITGTPLQNNLHELWALLNFLLLDVFSNSQDFDSWFSSEHHDQDEIVKQLHTVLQPFLLRRVKSDVETSLKPKKELHIYVGMSDMQKWWYRKILEKDIDAVNGVNGAKESKTRLLNIVMQLRKCCNHPYLFDGAEPGPPYTTDEHLVYNSGKLKVLDQLLKKLKANGSRVLIFSQMSRLLDILEDYCFLRGYEYCRIDGSTDHGERIKAIDEYNAPDSTKFIFLLTTRAGGLGINLTSADVVILYDSDWNPQADLQAMDRAHRIGQKKQVQIFRFVTNNSVEEKILERATQKLRLDKLVIHQGRSSLVKKEGEKPGETKEALISMIQHGAADIFKSTNNLSNEGDTTGEGNSDNSAVDLDAILKISESKTKALHEKYDSLGLDDLQKFDQESSYEWNGHDFKKEKIQRDIIDPLSINDVRKRGRAKPSYSIDEYYKDVLNTRKVPSPVQPRMPKPHVFSSHQLLRPELKKLFDKERYWIAKKTNYIPNEEDVKTTYGESLSEEELKGKLEEMKQLISNAEPLSAEEEKLKEQWSKEGFTNWNKLEFRKFISSSGKYGRNSIKAIAMDLAPGKSLEEVRAYAKAFWENYRNIDDQERLIKSIEVEEERLKKLKLQQSILRLKIGEYTNPFFDLRFKYPPSTSARRVYSEEEDRFILVTLNKYGLERSDIYEIVRDEIRQCPLFEMDFFFLGRTPLDLSRRANVLLQCLEKEYHVTSTGKIEPIQSMDNSKTNKRCLKQEEEEEEVGATGVKSSSKRVKMEKDSKENKHNSQEVSSGGQQGSQATAKVTEGDETVKQNQSSV